MKPTFDHQQDAFWANHINRRRYDHPVVRAFAQQRVDYIAGLLQSCPPASALDVGCGDGFGMQYMRRIVNTIHGCDRSAKMLAANPSAAACLKQCDAYQLDYADAEFDLVYCWELLHHVANPQRAVDEMGRVARRAVMLCEPNCLNPLMALFGIFKSEERGLLRFTPAFTKRLLQHAGLDDIRCHTVGWFTPNRTPPAMARAFVSLPYRVPLVGLYTIALGFKTTGR